MLWSCLLSSRPDRRRGLLVKFRSMSPVQILSPPHCFRMHRLTLIAGQSTPQNQELN
jgi:hypothetical protein